MFNDSRYILIDRNEVTPEILAQTEITEERYVRFAGDPIEYSVLKWKAGYKPELLYSEFPVYSDEEMMYLLINDLNNIPRL